MRRATEEEDDGFFVCCYCGNVFGPDEGDGDVCADCLYEMELDYLYEMELDYLYEMELEER
jgi:hypothetical protein